VFEFWVAEGAVGLERGQLLRGAVVGTPGAGPVTGEAVEEGGRFPAW